MNEERFWHIISLLDWSKEGNDDAVIEPAVQELSKLPESAILSFYDLLSKKLYLSFLQVSPLPHLARHHAERFLKHS